MSDPYTKLKSMLKLKISCLEVANSRLEVGIGLEWESLTIQFALESVPPFAITMSSTNSFFNLSSNNGVYHFYNPMVFVGANPSIVCADVDTEIDTTLDTTQHGDDTSSNMSSGADDIEIISVPAQEVEVIDLTTDEPIPAVPIVEEIDLTVDEPATQTFAADMEQLAINLERELVAESDNTPPEDLHPRIVDCVRNSRLFEQHFNVHRQLRWRKTRYNDLDEDLRSGIEHSNFEDMKEEMRGYYADFKENGAPTAAPDDLHDLAAAVGNLRMTESRGSYPKDRVAIPFSLIPEYWALYDTEDRMNTVIMFVETRVYYIDKDLELAHQDYTRFVIAKRSKTTRDEVEYYSHYLNWVTYRLGSRGMFPFMPMSDNFLVGEDFIEHGHNTFDAYLLNERVGTAFMKPV